MEVIFSYAGGLYPYLMGVAEVLQEMELEDIIYSCTSAGCIPAVLLNSRKNIKETFNEMIKEDLSKGTWEEIIRKNLEKYISEEDFIANKGKVICKLSKLNTFLVPEPVTVSEWTSRKDFIDCIVASCYVPFLCGNKLFLNYRGEKVLDGFFSKASSEPVTTLPNIYIHPEIWRPMKKHWYIPSSDKEWMRTLYTWGVEDANKNLKDFLSNMNKELELKN